ncbi:Nucleolar protein 12 [Pseudocyphellaria aurata]|nr:Nucleolar protein 12 [Pseudocyphellaria aurata]
MREGGIGPTSLNKQDSNLPVDNIDHLKEGDEERPELEIPTHHILASSGKSVALEKASRTVFLANVITMALKSKSAKRTLVDQLRFFLETLLEQEVAHKIESLRFRSTAYSAVYSIKLAAKEAINKSSGTVIRERHLHVDGVAHPAQIDR